MRIGSGTHEYEIAEGWGKLPENMQYGNTHGIVVDSQDRVYVHNTSKDAVVVFDRQGNFLNSWGAEFAEGAHGLFYSKESSGEYLYLADQLRHIVVKMTLEGKEVFRLGVPEGIYQTENEYRPTDVAVAPNGDFYVCDGYGKSWIHHYSPVGEYIRSWGGKGSDPGQLDCPHGIWVDTRNAEPCIYVADRKNHRIQVFTLEGEHLRFVTDDLDYICCFYQYGEELYIPDLHSRVTILDKEDKLIVHLGEDQEAWRQEGWPRRPAAERRVDRFVSPHAVCVDSHGDLYVAEWVPDGRVTKLIRCK
jgi:DNA-binding beta-propeller fold protein YncE